MLQEKRKNAVVSMIMNNRGEFGIKQIAMTIGIIIVVGAAVTFITSGTFLGTAIGDVWDWLFLRIQDIFG